MDGPAKPHHTVTTTTAAEAASAATTAATTAASPSVIRDTYTGNWWRWQFCAAIIWLGDIRFHKFPLLPFYEWIWNENITCKQPYVSWVGSEEFAEEFAEQLRDPVSLQHGEKTNLLVACHACSYKKLHWICKAHIFQQAKLLTSLVGEKVLISTGFY